MVQNLRRLVQTRPRRPWGVVNKTQPKAPLPQEGFGMKLGNVTILENAFCTESYLLQRFWRQGWIPNKTLSKLGGTDPVIGIGSDLLSAKP